MLGANSKYCPWLTIRLHPFPLRTCLPIHKMKLFFDNTEFSGVLDGTHQHGQMHGWSAWIGSEEGVFRMQWWWACKFFFLQVELFWLWWSTCVLKQWNSLQKWKAYKVCSGVDAYLVTARCARWDKSFVVPCDV